jgi:hypothetical protein
MVCANNVAYQPEIGIQRNADDANELTRIHISYFDNNLIYNAGTATAGFNKQATPQLAGANYNVASRNVAGVSLFDPSYTLPEATNRSLVFTYTSATDQTLAWGGGSAVQLVVDDGTATAGANASNALSGTLTDSGASWSTTLNSGTVVRCKWVKITGGTGSGQIRAITNNTATVLTVVPAWTTPPSTDSTYVILESEVQLFDSGATDYVRAGIDARDLPTSSQTDSNITWLTTALTSDPLLVDPTGTTTDDFKLQAGSPAIDAAIAAYAPDTDYWGTERPQGSAADLGFFEWEDDGPAPPPGTDILLTPVGDGEQLGGAVFRFAGSTAGGYFTSASNAPIPRLGTKSWAMLINARWIGGGGVQTLVSFYTNSSNYFHIFYVASDDTFRARLRIDNVERLSVSIPRRVLSLYTPLLVCRDGNKWGIYSYTLNSDGQPEFQKAETTVDLAASGVDTFDTKIATHADGRMHFGYHDGSSSKFNGSLGSYHCAICDTSETLSDYDLATDAEKQRLLLDHQRLFSACGFSASQVRSYGNWCDSSGVAKTTTKEAQLAASDRLVCPFSGNYLTLATGEASANALAYPAFSIPCHKPGITARGSRTQLTAPQAIEYAGGWLVATNQNDASLNPQYFGVFLGPDGEPNRWPIPVLVGYVYADSSDGGATKIWYNTIPGTTAWGDRHTDACVIDAGDCIAFSMHGHSGTEANSPASGDTLYGFPVWCLWDDDGPTLGWPITPDVGETNKTMTYSVMCRHGGKILQAWRASTSASGRIMATQFDETTQTFETVQVIAGTATRHNYNGWVAPLPDGRRLLTGFVTNDDNNLRATHWGVIGPKPTDTFSLNTNWFSLTGQPLDGNSGRPLLGGFNLNNNLTFHLLTDNDSFFPNLPTNNVGMDFMRIEAPCVLTGQWEGVAAVVRVSEENGDRSLSVTDSSGGTSDPWHRTEIRRWTYDRSTPSLTYRDTFDITSIIAALNPGAEWPQNTDLTIPEAAHVECMQTGPNQMILFTCDPEDVAVGANLIDSNLGGIVGFTVRAAVFHKMNAADPTQYVTFANAVITLPTDNSAGYGLYPYAVGSANDGSQSVLINVLGGDFDVARGYGNRVVKAFDLTAALNAALSGVTPPRAKSIFGSPIFAE